MTVSRYRNNDIVDNHFATFDFPDIDVNDIPTFSIRISHNDRLDALAFRHLGAGEYWWIIAWLNDIDWAFNFEDGQILKIPVNLDDVLDLF